MTDTNITENYATFVSPGTLLRKTREELDITLEEVSQALHLVVSKVQILEADEYQRLHSITFARGYLRNYAKLLNLDVDSIMQSFDAFIKMQAADAEGSEAAPAETALPEKSFNPIWLLPVAVAAVAAWFLLNPPGDTDAGNNSVVNSVSVETVVLESAVELTDTLAIETDSEEAQNTVALEISDDAAELTETLEPELDQLDFRFDDESWIEITDSVGDVLFADVKQKAETLTVQGVAPFTVMFGNARGVSMTLNDEAVKINVPSGHKTLKMTVAKRP